MTDSPRLIGRVEAAAYCGIALGTFSLWVATHKMPPAIPGTRMWTNGRSTQSLTKSAGSPRLRKKTLSRSGSDIKASAPHLLTGPTSPRGGRKKRSAAQSTARKWVSANNLRNVGCDQPSPHSLSPDWRVVVKEE